MKIRFIRTVRDGRYDFRAGDVVDLPPADANGFVQSGKARRDAELATDSVIEPITTPKKSSKVVRDVE